MQTIFSLNPCSMLVHNWPQSDFAPHRNGTGTSQPKPPPSASAEATIQAEAPQRGAAEEGEQPPQEEAAVEEATPQTQEVTPLVAPQAEKSREVRIVVNGTSVSAHSSHRVSLACFAVR